MYLKDDKSLKNGLRRRFRRQAGPEIKITENPEAPPTDGLINMIIKIILNLNIALTIFIKIAPSNPTNPIDNMVRRLRKQFEPEIKITEAPEALPTEGLINMIIKTILNQRIVLTIFVKIAPPQPIADQILMIDTSNVVHHEYKQNEEMKVNI